MTACPGQLGFHVAKRIDAEKAHKLAVWGLSKGLVARQRRLYANLATTVSGLSFDNPLGLAAGFDKDADALPGLSRMAFGFLEIGSVTPKPQPGNPKPRVFRIPANGAVVNRYGFNSKGLAYAAKQLESIRSSSAKLPPLGVNLGKNKETENAADDYVQGVRQLGEFSDYLVVNVSSPNTPGLRGEQSPEKLAPLLDAVLVERANLKNLPPLWLKIAPDLTEQDCEDVVGVLDTYKVDALVVGNTTLQRPDSLMRSAQRLVGGLSGVPLFPISNEILKRFYKLLDGTTPLVGVGGISSGQDAYTKIRDGASLVQLYTAMAVQGPALIGTAVAELSELLQKDGLASIEDAIGLDA
jgi:dihydroorotate dehydrogenase